jgi:hypothetical protein
VALHADSIVETLRLQDGATYRWGEPYVAVLTVSWAGDVAYLSGLHGRITRARWREIHDYLVGAGAVRAECVRRGRERTYARRAR